MGTARLRHASQDPVSPVTRVLIASARAADGGKVFVMALGQIVRPDRYETSPGETVWSLKEKAGGTLRLWGHKVFIRRSEAAEVKSLVYRYERGTVKPEEKYWRGIACEADDVVFFAEIEC